MCDIAGYAGHRQASPILLEMLRAQHARLVYDMLWQFDQEGRLKKEMRLQELQSGSRHRWYFSLEK